MSISDETMEESLHFLSNTDGKFANLKKQVEGLERYVELVKAQEFLEADGNIEHRKAIARTSEATREAQRRYLEALEEYEKLNNERQTSQTYIWCWRSFKASERGVG